MTTFVIMAILGGLVFGWLTGRRYQQANRAWGDYRARKAEVPLLRSVAWAATRPAAAFVVLAVVIAGYALYMAATGHR